MRITGPIEPMLAKSIERLPPPRPGGWRYEPKFDGYRALATIGTDSSVSVHSRRGTPLGPAFPEIVGALYAHLPAGTVMDGEIVCWRGGRLDFAALQHRYAGRHKAAELATVQTCHLVVFDVLETARDGDLRRRPLQERRVVLERLFGQVPARSPLSLAMHTSDHSVAQEWYDTMAVAGIEGLVIKPADGPYLPGAREWLKYKARQTTDAIVGGVTGSLRRPETLLLGRYGSDTGRLHYAGRTTRLTDARAAAVAPLLVAPTDGHPWPARLTVNWRSAPTDYLQVAPLVVVEIRADTATDRGRRWRHAVRMLRVRDFAPDEVPLDLDLES
ncbi:ATP-dependent DNA ligase [Actinopolymorpha singaporensis]|uniref:ATP-dependent DNA ligase n=1 Tax=Actinopolymorpha singaporensis TaxID=117157 RepID=A0A1H1T9S6_9ACTN|nr:ATP-dependent DNA ligase [Actinopolymorpha singaporensis]SDS56893.1 ATP-dependent DNA ligase [Actinopolymorpha singaporensis]